MENEHIKEIIRIIAERERLPVHQVKKAVEAYYTTLKEKIDNKEFTYIDRIGTLTLLDETGRTGRKVRASYIYTRS